MIQPEGALATEWCYHQRKWSTSFLVFVNLALTGVVGALIEGTAEILVTLNPGNFRPALKGFTFTLPVVLRTQG